MSGSTSAPTTLNNYFVLKGARLLPFCFVNFSDLSLRNERLIDSPTGNYSFPEKSTAFSVKRMPADDNPFDTFINFSY